jgi:hypothetical protein
LGLDIPLYQLRKRNWRTRRMVLEILIIFKCFNQLEEYVLQLILHVGRYAIKIGFVHGRLNIVLKIINKFKINNNLNQNAQLSGDG